MSNYKITIQETNNPTILKFDVNQFITKHQNFEYNNIDEAKESPLAQQLFFLPFVKKVYISSNFIAIERYNIVEWNDVKQEVADQIENYLNTGGIIVEEHATTKKVPVTVYTESTPNPSALKFVANKKLVTATYEYDSIEKAKTSPLATSLFHFPFVKSVFFDENYISITKYDIAEWNDVSMELRDFIKNYIENGKEIVNPDAPEVIEKSAEKQGLDTKQIEQDIKEVKDEVEDIAGSVKRNS